jgi:hypothetical protein
MVLVFMTILGGPQKEKNNIKYSDFSLSTVWEPESFHDILTTIFIIVFTVLILLKVKH